MDPNQYQNDRDEHRLHTACGLQLLGSLVCSLSRFTLKHYSRRKSESSAKQFLPPRFFFSAVRRGIFVETHPKKFQAPSGATYSDMPPRWGASGHTHHFFSLSSLKEERAGVRSQCLRAPRPNPPRLAGRGSYFSSARVSRCARLDGAWGFIASGSTNIPRLTALKFAFRENIPPLGT